MRPNHIVVAIDSSGSMDSKLVSELTNAVQDALNEGAADKITLLYADTDVQAFEHYSAGDLITLRESPRGGTAFDRALAWIAAQCPDASAILYMTDMDTSSWGVEPTCPLLWLVTGLPRDATHYAARAPFGESILIEQ